MTLRLVLADDHSMLLQGVQAFLAMETELEVVALCVTGLEAVEAVEEHGPDVLVMDAYMPRCGGLEAHAMLRERGIRVPTLLLTATLDDALLLRCLQASVDGIVLKEAAANTLVEAIGAVARGDRWIPPDLTARALDLLQRSEKEKEEEDVLTPREMEVVRKVAAGLSNKRVAAQLGVAESTVKLHLYSAFAKLDVRNRTQLSLLARERGWV